MTTPFTLTIAATPTAAALTLRPWRTADVPAAVAAFRDPAMRRWLPRVVADEAQGLAWVADLDAAWADGSQLSWAVQQQGTVVGYFVVKAADPAKAVATAVGYWTVAEVRGRGIASRCVEAATAWLFGGQDLVAADEVELLHTVGNEGSCRVAEKCGYGFDALIPPTPPRFPDPGHRHVRRRTV